MDKFYKQIVLFLLICIILLLLTYVYTCVLNDKKESFGEYPLGPSDKCYSEYQALQNCLNPDRSTKPSSIDIPEEPKKYGITTEEMISTQVEKLETALKSLNSKEVFFF